jgi:uncharacterized protein YuzE
VKAKPVHYTRHARSRMRQHRISEESVILTIGEPDQLLSSIKGRYNALKRIAHRVIRVTFREEADRISAHIGYYSVSQETSLGRGKMRIEYDKEADALCIVLRDVPASDSKDLEDGVTIDLDDKGHIVGLEVLDASERLGLEALLNISIENMPLEKIPLG